MKTTKQLLTLFLFLLVLFPFSYAAVNTTNIYLAYNLTNNYPASNIIRDMSGNGRNGTVTGTLYNWTGINGYSKATDGTSASYVSVPYLNALIGKNFSVSVWVYFNSTSGYDNILKAEDTSNAYGWGLLGIDGNNILRFNSVSSGDLTCNLTRTKGQWYHLVWVRKEGGSPYTNYLYQNGTLCGRNDKNYLTSGTWTYSQMFARQANAINGSIDELYIWENRLLSASEVTELYNSGTGFFYPFIAEEPPAEASLSLSTTLAEGTTLRDNPLKINFSGTPVNTYNNNYYCSLYLNGTHKETIAPANIETTQRFNLTTTGFNSSYNITVNCSNSNTTASFYKNTTINTLMTFMKSYLLYDNFNRANSDSLGVATESDAGTYWVELLENANSNYTLYNNMVKMKAVNPTAEGHIIRHNFSQINTSNDDDMTVEFDINLTGFGLCGWSLWLESGDDHTDGDNNLVEFIVRPDLNLTRYHYGGDEYNIWNFTHNMTYHVTMFDFDMSAFTLSFKVENSTSSTTITNAPFIHNNFPTSVTFQWSAQCDGIGYFDNIEVYTYDWVYYVYTAQSINITQIDTLKNNQSVYMNYSYLGNFSYTEWYQDGTLKANNSNVYYNYTGLTNGTQYNLTFIAYANSTVYSRNETIITTEQNIIPPVILSINITQISYNYTNQSVYLNFSYFGNLSYVEWYQDGVLKANNSLVYHNYTGLINNTLYNFTIKSYANITIFSINETLITTLNNTVLSEDELNTIYLQGIYLETQKINKVINMIPIAIILIGVMFWLIYAAGTLNTKTEKNEPVLINTFLKMIMYAFAGFCLFIALQSIYGIGIETSLGSQLLGTFKTLYELGLYIIILVLFLLVLGTLVNFMSALINKVNQYFKVRR